MSRVNRVLVTGATGFIGRGTLPRLIAQGAEVHAITSRRELPGPEHGVNWHRADLLGDPRVGDLVREIAPTHLLHLAWYAEPGAFWSSSRNLSWVEASLRLVRAFADHGGRRAVIAGTCAEYEWAQSTVCRELDTPCRPATLYGASKHALHLIADRYAETAGLSLAWGRIFFVFGPGEDPSRLVGSVAQALTQGHEAPCTHGRQRRDFLYSEDLADAFVSLLLSDVQGPVNLASGQATSIAELVTALARAAGRSDLLRLGALPASANEPIELVADVTRLREEVGWAPSAPLAQRAAETIGWWQAAGGDGRLGAKLDRAEG